MKRSNLPGPEAAAQFDGAQSPLRKRQRFASVFSIPPERAAIRENRRDQKQHRCIFRHRARRFAMKASAGARSEAMKINRGMLATASPARPEKLFAIVPPELSTVKRKPRNSLGSFTDSRDRAKAAEWVSKCHHQELDPSDGPAVHVAPRPVFLRRELCPQA